MYDPCPECRGPTEVKGESCSRCCARHEDTWDIVDTIYRQGKQTAQDPDRLDEYRGGPFKVTNRDLEVIREKLKK